MNESKWRKFVPLWSIMLFAVLVGVLILTYQQNQDASVMDKQAVLMEKSAQLWEARQPFLDALPSILVSGAYLALGVLVGVGVLVFLVSLASSVLAGNVTKVVNNGIGYYKETPHGKTKTFFAPVESVVSAYRADRLNPGPSVGFPGMEPAYADLERGSIDAQVRPGHHPHGSGESHRGWGNALRKAGFTNGNRPSVHDLRDIAERANAVSPVAERDPERERIVRKIRSGQ